MPSFKQMPMEPSQLTMFPVSVNDSISAEADVRLFSDAMDAIDWSVFDSEYSQTGCPAYPPRVLCKILVYGLSKGVRSSRALEDLVRNHRHYIFLAGGLTPDHSTISRFRKSRQDCLRLTYRNTVRMCAEAGLVLLNVTATDGSKIQASSSRRSLYKQKRIEREMAAIDRILAEVEEVDAAEDELYGSASGSEMPAELVDAKERKRKLQEIAKRLKESGRSSVSETESDCRIMKTTSGLRPAYNVQATVDSSEGVIVAADVIDAETDNEQLEGQMKQVEENTGLRPDVSLADTGYSDEATFKYLARSGQDALLPPHMHPQEKKRNDLFASKCFVRDQGKDVLICPAGRELAFRRTVSNSSGDYRVYTAGNCRDCSFCAECVTCKVKTSRSVQVSVVAEQRDLMLARLATPEGKELYALRQRIVERVFANIKTNMGLNRFLLSGKQGVASEIWLACMAHNLMIYVRKQASATVAAARTTIWRLRSTTLVDGRLSLSRKRWRIRPLAAQFCDSL